MIRTICIDFDGVIHRYSKGWQDGRIYDPPIQNAVKALNTLQNEGYRVYILSARADTIDRQRQIRRWCIKQGIDMKFITVSNVKVAALAYIDDRAIRFTNWDDMLKYFTEQRMRS